MSVNRNFRVTAAGNNKKDVTAYIKNASKYKAKASGTGQNDAHLVNRMKALEQASRVMADRFNREQGLSLHLEGECSRLKQELEHSKATAVQKEAEAALLLQELQSSRETNKALTEQAEALEKQCAQLEVLRQQLGGLIVETKRKTERYVPAEDQGAPTDNSSGRKEDFFRRDINYFRKNLSELESQIAGGLADISSFIDNAHLELEEEPEILYAAEAAETFDFNAAYYYDDPNEQPEQAPMLEVEATIIESYEAASENIEATQSKTGDADDVLPLSKASPVASVLDAQYQPVEDVEEQVPTKRRYWLNFKLKRESVHADDLHKKQRTEDDFVEDTLATDPLFSAPIWAEENTTAESGFRRRLHEYRKR